ncbi:hypothetical protein H3C61_00110 [Candidatus Gracilibacteria bacterium]|nr:hypothetical protein [Candidatus Gracilibacteria bacterium]
MKKLLFLLLLFITHFTYATGEIINNSQIDNFILQKEDLSSFSNLINESINLNSSINNDYTIDLSQVKKLMENEIYNYEFEWEMDKIPAQNGPVFKKNFIEKGIKELKLNIYAIKKNVDNDTGNNDLKEEKKLIFSNNYLILVYDKSFLIFYSNEIDPQDIKNYIDFASKDGILIDVIGPLSKTDLEVKSLLSNINNFKEKKSLKSDFITIWGTRDFVFSVLSNINKDISNNNLLDRYNIIALSSYNLDILGNYLKNFLANKSWIKKIVLLNENSKYMILKQDKIENLIKELEKNNYNFLDINLKETTVSNTLFISKFINNLSNKGYSTNNIYLFLIIPIILIIIISFKHFIGLSPIGIIIPLFITLLFFKLGIYSTLFFIFFYVILNIILSVITDRYNLLYAPKISFLLGINLISFILFINIISSFNLISLNFFDTLYFIIFILLSDKMINIITSKDLLEYKESFFYTLLIALFSYMILNINTIKIILLSYPEIILLTIPISFLIGKFTGLRVTEYFRFKEIIKSVEEE